MPRVKDVVRDYEQLSVLQATHSPARRTRSAIPRVSRAPPRIIHPLLRAALPDPPAPTGFEHARTGNSPDTPTPYDYSERQSTTFPFTTLTRNDGSLLLSHLNYSHTLSVKDSASSLSTKVDAELPPRLTQDQDDPKLEAPSHALTNLESVTDDFFTEDFFTEGSADHAIPSETVFRRDAPILSLPILDEYLAALPAPTFSLIQDVPSSSKKGPPDPPRMFLPLQELAKGRSLADMFCNRKVALPYRNRDSIFSSVRI